MDIREQIKEALAAEEIQNEIAKLKSPPKKGWDKTWSMLNTQVGGWFLGSVLLGLVTFGWTVFQENCGSIRAEKEIARINANTAEKYAAAEKVRQRNKDDSEFLVKILPTMTNNENFEARCQTVKILAFRHPEFNINSDCSKDSKDNVFPEGSDDQSMCRGLREIADIAIKNYANSHKDHQIFAETCDFLIKQKDIGGTSTSAKISTSGNDESPTLVKNPDRSSETQNLVKQLPPRVYIQIFDERDRERAKALQTKLRGKGFLAPGIENVGDESGAKANPLKKNVIRYFNDDLSVANDIRGVTGPDFETQQNPGNANKGSLEIWFKAPQP